MFKQQIHKCRCFFVYTIYRYCKNSCFVKYLSCSPRREDVITKFLKAFSNLDSLFFVSIIKSDYHLLMLWKIYSCSLKCLIKCFVEVFWDTETLTCWFHFRSKAYLCSPKFFKWEYRHLDGNIFWLLCKSCSISEIFNLCTKYYFCCKIYDRNTCYLADIWNGTAWTRIYLNYIHLVMVNNKLYIYKSDYMKWFCKFSCVIDKHILYSVTDSLCRIYRDTVSRMNTCSLDMLHDTRYKNILTVAYGIYLYLFTHKIFIYKNRVFLMISCYNLHKFLYIIIWYCYLHTLSAKYIWRTDKYRITKLVCDFKCFFCCEYRITLCSWYLALLEYLIKQFSILCGIYILCTRSENLNPHLHKWFGKVDSCLATKLYYCPVRFFKTDNIFNILRCKRLKIEFICYIKVCTDCFRIVIYYNSLITFFPKCPYTVNRTIVKLYTLSYSDRSWTKNNYLFLFSCIFYFIHTVKAAIIIWSFWGKLCRTGINHLKRCRDAILITEIFNLFLSLSCPACNYIIRKFKSLSFF